MASTYIKMHSSLAAASYSVPYVPFHLGRAVTMSATRCCDGRNHTSVRIELIVNCCVVKEFVCEMLLCFCDNVVPLNHGICV